MSSTIVEPISIARYLELIRLKLSAGYECPPAAVERLMSEYDSEIRACWTAGLDAAGLIKLLYADWKIFGATPR